jgi:hypothetical protein
MTKLVNQGETDMSATSKPAHITVEGKPLCECEGHMAGLMYRLNVTCGHVSIASAKRAKVELQKHRHSVRVVPGFCPAN